MKRPSSLPILVQVAVLTTAAVLASLGIAFAIVLLAPPPPPAGMTVQAAAEALEGRPARMGDGKPLVRRIVAQAPAPATGDDVVFSRFLGVVLAEQMQRGRDDVRVMVPTSGARNSSLGVSGEGPTGLRETLVLRRRGPAADAASDSAARLRGEGQVTSITARSINGGPPGQIDVLTRRLTFTPRAVAARQPDGRWAVVEPPRDLLSPWQARVLGALGGSLLLLAPLVWWMARRLTRPIRLFAVAAERLGADPEAAPLAPSGPAEVRTAIEAFNDMQASLKRHMRQRTQTVAAIAHDLRTPLTRLRFRAEQAPARVRDRMAADIEEMDALIGQAMAYVRGEAPTHRRERFDLAVLASEVARGFAETGAAVSATLPQRLWVEADPAALRRALSNLIGNAVKYAEATEVTGRIDGDTAIIIVADRGPGVPDEDLELLFEPFRRGEASRSRDTGGAGLGLTVARQAARAGGGDVALANRPKGGLIARLNLPLAS
ncbi:MAG: HAMP domain-containing protein [Brevundimonas sp.]|uniref:ATP-binding protein n=1 Tax=Brevundimonas sp. TaxID=1871086 RepID=UPI00121CBCBB|nr:ATP-binding protein [Brevundimonas sp.]RZJ16793.1 MAG: HAMP domain-containing protein [Brevundimonas sp.]